MTFVECFRKLYCNVTDISGDLDCIVVMFDIVPTKKSIPYRTGQNLSYRSVNRYRNTYVSFRFKFWPIPDCTGLTGENRMFRPVKLIRAGEEKTRKTYHYKRKKPRICYRHRFQPCALLCFFFLHCFSFTAFFSPHFFFSVLHRFSCGCTEDLAGRQAKFISFLFCSLTSALLNAKVKKYILKVSF